ncbi:uncharacterized protein LOC110704050 [Chenopodium quinoa]|uniref:uncharacterized protein LOC110704050 n=1 Tax=Chenopodium quinoa TaxID=63459 RepID=UPI000B7933E5|nr:uncharacterized protein LOC110704050 [Chenopodium quinoa]
MEDIVFGKVAAMVYVVEFQKRGLPHAHFLIILEDAYNLKGPSDYDKFVTAEIPSLECPQLRKIVLGHMMHGPCGILNPKCTCMIKEHGSEVICKYSYPKPYLEETTTNEDGFPILLHHSSGQIPVQVCVQGHDRVSFNVVGQQNQGVYEINDFQSGRWVSPCEAAWRIFGFDLFEMTPSVQLLPVHLPNMQTIYMRSHEQLNVVVQDEKRSTTALTEFLRLNATIPGGTRYRYT